MVATTVLFLNQVHESGPIKQYLLLTMTYTLGFLMVSNIPYSSFKEIDWFQKMPFRALVLTILLFSIIAVQPAIMLFTLMLVYVGSGPVEYARRVLKVRKHPLTREKASQELLNREERTE